MNLYEYKVEEVLSQPGEIGDLEYSIPAYQILEIIINKLSKDNWKIVMMDVVNPDMIIAVFERLKHVEFEIEE